MRHRQLALPRIHVTASKAKHIKHIVKWSLIHCALVLFFADLVAIIWPAFGSVWNGPVEKAGVALAAFFTCIAEYLYDDEELKKHVKEEERELAGH